MGRGWTKTKAYDKPVLTKDCQEVISEMEFESEEDRILCLDIIENLEHHAAEEMKADKAVQIPYIGSFKRNRMYEKIGKHRDEFKLFRSTHNVTEYKEFAGGIVGEIVKELDEIDEKRVEFVRMKQRARKLYQRIYLTKGKDAAHKIIEALLRMKPIPFDQEVEDYWQEIYKNSE